MSELGQLFFTFLALYGIVSALQDFDAWCDRRRKRRASQVTRPLRETP